MDTEAAPIVKTKPKKIRCTLMQKKLLVEYMYTHRTFANLKYLHLQQSPKHEAEWVKLGKYLSQHGPVKDVNGWKATWRELTRKARMAIKQSQAASGDESNVAPLDELNLKVISVLTDELDQNAPARTSTGNESPAYVHVSSDISEESSNNSLRRLSTASSVDTPQHSKSHSEDPIGDIEVKVLRKHDNGYNDINELDDDDSNGNTSDSHQYEHIKKCQMNENLMRGIDSGINSSQSRADDSDCEGDVTPPRKVIKRDVEVKKSLSFVAKKGKGDNNVKETQRHVETSMTPVSGEAVHHAAKAWAITLNQLPRYQQLCASRVINEVLFQAQMGKLSSDTKLVLRADRMQNTSGPITL